MKDHNNWINGKLGQLCSIEIGGTPSRNNPAYWDTEKTSGNSWVSIRDLNRKNIDTTSECITNAGVKHSNAKLQSPDTILLSFKLTIGRVGIARKPLYTNEAIAGLRSDYIDHDFLYYGIQQWDLLQSVDQAIKGATLNKKKLKDIEFKYPINKSEQSKIAEILSTVDRAIEQTEALITKQQRIKTGLMQDLLTRGIDENGNIRSEETHQFKDSPLGRIPVEWEIVKISSVLKKPPKNGFSPLESDNWNNMYVLGLGCLTANGFRPIQLKNSPILTTNNYNKAILTDGDFLISRSNTRELVGLVGIFRNVGVPCIYPDLMVRLVFTEEVITEYMEQVFMSFTIRQQIKNAATGTSSSMVKISSSLIKNFTFLKPQKNEQSIILKKLLAQDFTILGYNKIIAKLQSLKTALMQDLLTGNVRVTPLLGEETVSV